MHFCCRKTITCSCYVTFKNGRRFEQYIMFCWNHLRGSQNIKKPHQTTIKGYTLFPMLENESCYHITMICGKFSLKKIVLWEKEWTIDKLTTTQSESRDNLTKVRPLFKLSLRGSDNSPLLIKWTLYELCSLDIVSWIWQIG